MQLPEKKKNKFRANLVLHCGWKVHDGISYRLKVGI